MIKRTAAVLGWLVAGHLLLGGLYWSLLQVPESNAIMLAVSLLLVLAIVWWFGAVEGVGLLASPAGSSIRATVLPVANRAWLIVFPLFVFAVIWLLTGRVAEWFARHGSEIDAWIILKTGWTKTNQAQPAIDYALAFVRYGVGLSLTLTLFAALLRRGPRAVLSADWVKQAFAWRQLALFAVALVVGILLPGRILYWTWLPKNQAGTWFELAFAGTKLTVLFVWANLVWAIALGFVARRKT